MAVTNKYRHATCAAIAVTAWLAAQSFPAHASGLDEIQIFVENDFLAGTDRYYSNGLKIGFGAQKEAWPKFRGHHT